jgi:hypothetical protein
VGIRDKAALLEYMADCAAESQRIAETHVFDGLGDICGEIASLAERVKDALDVDALGTELRSRRRS